MKRSRVTGKCPECGSQVISHSSYKKKFCSNVCRYSSNSTREMQSLKLKASWARGDFKNCGKYQHSPHQLFQKGHKGIFAPKRENHPSWKGGLSIDNPKEYRRQWSLKNRELKYHFNNQRRMRKANAEGSHSLDEWQKLKENYNFTCPSCGVKEPFVSLTRDHIKPLVKGGSDFIENIQPLCKSCNSKKSTKQIKFVLC